MPNRTVGAQSSRLLSGARAESYDQIVDVPTRHIEDEVPEVFQSTPQDRISERIVARIVDFPLPQIQRQMVKVATGACFGAGRRTDRRSGSAPDLRVQALPTVVHRPAESVLLLTSTVVELVRHESRQPLGQLRELGRHQKSTHQASIGSHRLAQCSTHSCVGFRPTSNFWCTTGRHSFLTSFPSRNRCWRRFLRCWRVPRVTEICFSDFASSEKFKISKLVSVHPS